METKIDKRSTVVLFIILIVTLIVSAAGITYAYFRVIVTKTNVSSMIIKATNLQITYNETKNISSTDIEPGWSDTKTFTVRNTGERTIYYSLKFTNVVNTLVNKSYLKYTITGTGSNAYNNATQIIFPSTDTYAFTNRSIATGVTHSYTMTVSYINDPSFDQSDDMGKSFAASFEIEATQTAP